jgi:hypothetical protein
MCSTNCKYRTAVTLYTLETMVSFRYIIVNTVHKGENKDDDIIIIIINFEGLDVVLVL